MEMFHFIDSFFFVESSWHLRWLETVFPNSNWLFSQIPRPPPPPPPKIKCQTGLLNFIWLSCHIHYFEFQSFDQSLSENGSSPKGESWVLSALNILVVCESLKKKTVSSFLKSLNSRGKTVLIMNQLKSANCSKVNLSYFTCIKFLTF